MKDVVKFEIFPEPVTLAHCVYKFGGRITQIDGIGHREAKPENGYSRDHWFYRGRVEWESGKVSNGYEIAPNTLCYDGHVADTDSPGFKEVLAMGERLSDYLERHGEWKETGNARGWNATRS